MTRRGRIASRFTGRRSRRTRWWRRDIVGTASRCGVELRVGQRRRMRAWWGRWRLRRRCWCSTGQPLVTGTASVGGTVQVSCGGWTQAPASLGLSVGAVQREQGACACRSRARRARRTWSPPRTPAARSPRSSSPGRTPPRRPRSARRQFLAPRHLHRSRRRPKLRLAGRSFCGDLLSIPRVSLCTIRSRLSAPFVDRCRRRRRPCRRPWPRSHPFDEPAPAARPMR